MNRLTSFAACLVLASVLFAGAAAEAQVNVDIGGDTGASVGGNAGVDTSTDANATTSGSMDGSDTDSSTNASGSAAASLGASLTITQDEAASASVDAESAELDASAVANGDDLRLYVTSMMKRDPNMEDVEASSDEVSVTYRQSAHFLGFIPAHVNTEVSAHADGNVDVDYPWYRFLFSVDGSDDLEARLEARVQQVLAASANATAGLSASAEAALIDEIRLALAGSGSAAADASAY